MTKKPFVDGGETKSDDISYSRRNIDKRYWRGKSERELGAIVQNGKKSRREIITVQNEDKERRNRR